MTYASEVLADSPWGFWETTTSNRSMGQTGPMASEKAIAWGAVAGYASCAGVSTSAATAEAWVYLSSYPTIATQILGLTNGFDSPVHDKNLYIDTSGRAVFFAYSGAWKYATASSPLSLNTWHHVVGSVGASGMKIRVDKVTLGTDPTTTSDTTAYTYMMMRGGGGGILVVSGQAAMKIAAPAFWTSQLSDAQTDAHYDAGSSGYQAAVLADTPWGFWEQAETSGTTLSDSSGNSRSMAILDLGGLADSSGNVRPMDAYGSASTANQTGPFASEEAISWANAVAGYTMTAAKNSTNDVTLEAWVYLTSAPSVLTTVIGCANAFGDATRDKEIHIDTDGKVKFHYYPGTPITIAAPAALTLNTWHHLVASVGAAGGKIRVDKVQVAYDARTTSWTGSSQAIFTRGGGEGYTGTGAMKIAAPAFWNSQLTDARTDAHYDAGMTAGIPTTTAALPLTVGLSAAAATIAKSTVALAIAIGMAAVASTVATTTASFPISVGMSAVGSVVSGTPSTTATFPLNVGMGASASTIASTTAQLPITAGFGAVGSIVSTGPTTSEFPIGVGFDVVGSIVFTGTSTTAEFPISVGFDIAAVSYVYSDLVGYSGENNNILIAIELSGTIDPIFPPPVPPVDFAGLVDPTVAPTLTKSDTADGHLLVGTYRYSYAGWKGSQAQATAPSPTADITLTAEDTVTLTFPTVTGADGYLVYREDL